MVQADHNKWVIHNTRTKDIGLPEAMGFMPDKGYGLK